MNKKSAVLVGAGVTGASYLAYRSICEEMMKQAVTKDYFCCVYVLLVQKKYFDNKSKM